MKYLINIILVTFLIVMLSCQSKQENNSSISEIPNFFNRLVGTWKMDNSPLHEEWIKKGESFSGKSYQTTGKLKQTKESFILHATTDAIYYRVRVFNQNDGKPIDFLLTKADNNEVWFEKSDHDFPKKIKYLLLDDNHLITEISGIINGEMKSMEFAYSRKN